MQRIKILLSLFAVCFFATATFAQQSSKTKAAKKLYEKGNKVNVINATYVNTTQLEFSPSFYQNGIVFASSRVKHGIRDEKINETFFELFYADIDGNGFPLRPKPFSMNVNSQLHEGPVTFSRDGSTMYFTRNNSKKGVAKADEQKKVRLKIFQAQKGEMDWENISELPFNNDAYSTAHPTLSADGLKLFFASDMPGGLGGMDIWVIERTGNGWSEPINLGPDVNTDRNELFPFIHSSGNLFFTSNGYPGAGGLDLYMVELNNGQWGKVTNLGEPFNTPADDLSLILNPDGDMGFFASSRDGGKGKDDIYQFEAPEGIWGKTKASMISSNIRIFDAGDGHNIEGAEIRVFEKTSDGFIGNGNDLYEAVLLPSDQKTGELVFKLVRKDASSLGNPDRLSDNNGIAPYQFLGERKYLVLVSKEGYNPKEVVYSTIGNTGSATIEVPLSISRCAELSGTVRNKLTNSIIPNAVVRIWSGCDESEQEILSNTRGEFSYCLPPGCEYMIKGMKDNYVGEFEKISTSVNNNPMRSDVLLSPTGMSRGVLKEGTLIVLENIYYDFNKSHIRVGAARELDDLITLMQQNPSMRIELGSHTDSRGSDAYNQQLSDRRADSAKQYLVSKGIDSSRVRAVGFGEAQLRNSCVDGVNCSEEDHQYNRRTQVKVIGLDVQYEDKGPEVIDQKRSGN